MPVTSGFLTYRIDIEWMLTWFPIQGNAAISAQHTRCGTIHYINTDAPFSAGNSAVHLLGQGPQAPFTFGDQLPSPNNLANGHITVGVNQDEIFTLDIAGRLGSANNSRLLLAPPNARLPFMINLIGTQHPEVQGTALTLYGTITTGQRPADLVTRTRS